MSRVRVLVLGAGIVGAAVAERLAARDGLEVTVVDKATPASGASGASFAWVNSNGKTPAAYHQLNVAGMAEYARRRELLGDAYRPVGHLEVAADPAAATRLAATVAALDAVGYRAVPIRAARLRELEPALALPAEPELVVHFPDEGYCDVDRVVGRLLATVRGCGGVVRGGVRVVGLDVGASTVTARTSTGERLTADRVVLCLGRWTPDLADQVGPPIPMVSRHRAEALLAITGPVRRRPARVISTPGLNLRPFHDDRLMLQALDLDRERGPDATAEFAARARAVLPGEPELQVAAVLEARRAIPADGLTVAGWLDPGHAVYAVATHSGVTLALLLGRLVAAEIDDREQSPLLARFRPDRFGSARP
jgi:glycine/D-amino acid oxidase-like deaminating enzyme